MGFVTFSMSDFTKVCFEFLRVNLKLFSAYHQAVDNCIQCNSGRVCSYIFMNKLIENSLL